MTNRDRAEKIIRDYESPPPRDGMFTDRQVVVRDIAAALDEAEKRGREPKEFKSIFKDDPNYRSIGDGLYERIKGASDDQ